MITAKRAIYCWLILFIILTFPGWVQAAEFSAQMVTQGADSEGLQGKVYVKGNKIRQEFVGGEGAHISILRPDKKVVWMLMPDQKIYMEMPLTPQTSAKMMQAPQDQSRMKLVGTEEVNGYAADKYEATDQEGGKSSTQYVWVAKKLGWPIKMTSSDNSFAMEYRNIKEGGVSDSLFEVPAGYQKMSMPAGMPMK